MYKNFPPLSITAKCEYISVDITINQLNNSPVIFINTLSSHSSDFVMYCWIKALCISRPIKSNHPYASKRAVMVSALFINAELAFSSFEIQLWLGFPLYLILLLIFHLKSMLKTLTLSLLFFFFLELKPSLLQVQSNLYYVIEVVHQLPRLYLFTQIIKESFGEKTVGKNFVLCIMNERVNSPSYNFSCWITIINCVV